MGQFEDGQLGNAMATSEIFRAVDAAKELIGVEAVHSFKDLGYKAVQGFVVVFASGYKAKVMVSPAGTEFDKRLPKQ